MRGQDKEDFEAQPLLGQHGDQGAQFFDELFAISRRAPRGALCVPRLFVPAARSSRTRVRRVTMVAVGLSAKNACTAGEAALAWKVEITRVLSDAEMPSTTTSSGPSAATRGSGSAYASAHSVRHACR